MATPAISFNPMLTTNAAGYFNVLSDGLVQGTAMDSPNSRFNLAGGIIATSETLPMWGGVGIYENVPAAPGNSPLGGTIGRAAGLSTLTGFSVFDQANNGVTTPQSNVPTYGSGMTANFYRLGSGARIAVKAVSSLANADGNSIIQQVSWDFTNQQLVPYAPAYAAVTVTGATWAATGTGQIDFTITTDLQAVLSAGDIVNVSGITPTGYNGAWEVVSVPDATSLIVKAPNGGTTADPGAYSSGGTNAIAAGGGALSVKILQFQPSNCKTVDYSTVTGFATWNTNGACALILL